MKHTTHTLASLLIAMACLHAPAAAAAIDADEAQALAKKEGCFKCHAIDKKKEAKSLQEIATKLKGTKDADAKIYEHLTTGPKVKLEDGSEEDHKILKTKDKAAIDNLIGWIRSLAK